MNEFKARATERVTSISVFFGEKTMTVFFHRGKECKYANSYEIENENTDRMYWWSTVVRDILINAEINEKAGYEAEMGPRMNGYSVHIIRKNS